ncbi:hypothetical protein EDB92DRAFT_374315 [Lactarius akahatsu]|uniref:Uncharacterized protein n=1 Tax=Lactarius akahatsu TaxID=416441 RepID=A0AAD4QEK4_9AGAM|nr:hypothetical protein EDB92DRAFT_374315 [Lactarius akahatsu]
MLNGPQWLFSLREPLARSKSRSKSLFRVSSLSLPRFDPFPFRELRQRFQPTLAQHLATALRRTLCLRCMSTPLNDLLSSSPKRDILSTGTCRDTLYASSFRGIQGTYLKFIGHKLLQEFNLQASVILVWASRRSAGASLSQLSSGGVLPTSISPKPYRGLREASVVGCFGFKHGARWFGYRSVSEFFTPIQVATELLLALRSS